MANTFNIAQGKTATASSSVLPYTPSKALDGLTTPFNRWLCNSVPGWLAIDFGSTIMIYQWVVKHMPVAGWQSPDYVNSDFALQASNDGNTWSTIDSVANNTASTITRTLTNSYAARFFRVMVTKGLRTNNQMVSIMELQLFQAPYLTNLSLSSGVLNPAYSLNVYNYTASVENNVTSITVTPTSSPNTAITVNGVVVASGQASSAIPLNIGANTITVCVTDSVKTQNYTLVVTRKDSAYLSSLTVQSGTTPITLNPLFVKTTLGYSANVSYAVSNVVITPTAESPNASVTVNGTLVASGHASQSISLNVGSNTIAVVVTAAGTTQSYTITITRADSLYLSNLQVMNGTTPLVLSPTFNKTTLTGYTAKADYNTTGITIIPTAESSNATITVNGTTVASGTSSAVIPLTIGTAATINVVVTSPAGSQTYSVSVTRQTSAYLNVFQVKKGLTSLPFNPVFTSANQGNYTLTVTQNNPTITATAQDPLATIVVTLNGNTITKSGSLYNVIFTSGTNYVVVIVTSTSGDVKSYTLTVTL
jgi:hypothetical protein